ncbi:enoyl-CoA hydratase/isomerase family protein [Duganella sp. FT92W]|uniref:Enoyl-CoA hydratase/isomerase family protein n=1 Tax=Pseudoduganella rivuli TaxID=2666085 RepID=A0A7X2IPM4_9BURK|nr:enoyl-CoA hydratase/isomerase family protein [Pseudoduganella rivuli]MRV73735.1 enoyl-CoA hydratase/isomerase family protein [Pseudoduganella rivuli]
MKNTRIRPGGLEMDNHGAVLLVRLDGGPHGIMGLAMADALAELVDELESGQEVKAVILTGAHPGRFIGHADVRWLQEGGTTIPSIARGMTSAVAYSAATVRRMPLVAPVAAFTPLGGAMQLDKLHNTFMRMNRCGVLFIGALNGSALGLGSELAQACDVRLMADGDFIIGQPEVLLGIPPGGGGTQRLTRLVGAHRALMMMLEGRPASPARALEIGLVDEVVAPDRLIERALELAQYLGARPRDAIRAIKRAVYVGGSMSLEDGLHVERTEFMSALSGDSSQSLMLEYMDRTEHEGDLPLYEPVIFEQALKLGHFPFTSSRTVK